MNKIMTRLQGWVGGSSLYTSPVVTRCGDKGGARQQLKGSTDIAFRCWKRVRERYSTINLVISDHDKMVLLCAATGSSLSSS